MFLLTTDAFAVTIVTPMRRGYSIIELMLVVVLLGILGTMAVPTTLIWRDRSAVAHATTDIVMAHWRARSLARTHRWRVALDLSGATIRLRRVGPDADSTLVLRPGPDRYGVSLVATRTTIMFGPTGIGWGPANTTVWLLKGDAEATIVTSRLGRLRTVAPS